WLPSVPGRRGRGLISSPDCRGAPHRCASASSRRYSSAARSRSHPMRGHIVQRGKRYYAVVYEGTDPATGKRIRRWYAAGDTRRSAEKLLNEIVKRVHDGDYRAPDRITLGDYLTERWLPTKRAQLRRSTFDSYRRNVENHVLPRIGDLLSRRSRPRTSTSSTP